MLTRIEIDGFKTFRDFALDVPPFLVVLGPNAAGKSNLFDALAFLAQLAQGANVMQAVRESRGQLTDLLHRDSTGRTVDTIRFAVEVRVRPTVFEFEQLGPASDCLRYELDLVPRPKDSSDPEGTLALSVGRERVFESLLPAPGRRPEWQLLAEGSGAGADDPGDLRSYGFGLRWETRMGPAEVSARPVEHVVRVLGELRDQVGAWRVLALEPSSLRREDSYDDDSWLGSSGEHLPNALARITRRTKTAERPEGVLSDLTNDLATVIPEVVGLKVIDSRPLRRRVVSVTDRGGGEFTADALSDGTLRTLALVTALNDPEQAGLLCVEEPENGVFPNRLGRLIELMGTATSGLGQRQVLVSSHSPAVLAALPPVGGRALRDDAVFLDTASLVLPEPGAFSRVTSARPLRGDPSVPLPPELSGPVMSAAEIRDYLGPRMSS